MPVDRLKELPAGTILRQRVCGRPQAVESVLAVLVRLELAAQVVVALVLRILEVVLAVAARLPHVEGDVRDRLLGDEILDHTVHVGDGALVLVLDDRVAELAPRSIG